MGVAFAYAGANASGCRPDDYACAGACVKAEVCEVPLEIPSWNLGFGDPFQRGAEDCASVCASRIQLITPECRETAYGIAECFAQRDCQVLQEPGAYTRECLVPLQAFGQCMTNLSQTCCQDGDPCEIGQNDVCECPAQLWDEDCGGVDTPLDRQEI